MDRVRLTRAVDGAIVDCMNKHPEYFAPGARLKTVRQSLVKRIVGSVQSSLVERPSGSAGEQTDCAAST